MVELVASKLQAIPKSSYTSTDVDGNDTMDTALKDDLEKVQERRINTKLVDDYSKFEGDWERFYATIMGQPCPATKEELRRSTEWEGVATKLDPGALLTLIQSTCLNGNDKDYYPKRVISALRELVSKHQGNNSPSEFAEVTKTVLNKIKSLLKIPSGQTFSEQLPGMREHAIGASDKFNFDVKDYGSQTVEVKHLVHQECENIMIGCFMTVL